MAVGLATHCGESSEAGTAQTPDTPSVPQDTNAPTPDAMGPADIGPTDATDPPDARGDILETDAADVAGDTIESDVPTAPDTSPDVPPAPGDTSPTDGMDGSPETQLVDAVPPKPSDKPLFRIDQLVWGAPDLCYVPTDNNNAPCVPLTSLVNALIEDMVNATEAPTDVLFQFDGPIDQDGYVAMSVGEGLCKRDEMGVIQQCVLESNADTPTVIFDDVPIATMGACGESLAINAPCFSTPPKNGLVLTIAGVTIGLKNAAAAGQFQGINPLASIHDGHLQGFMPTALAQTIQFNLPTGQALTLAQLLSQVTTIEVDGHPGWTIEFKFDASQQPTL